MKDLKKKSLVKKIGVSVYTAQQIDTIANKFPIDIIQLPINVFDQHLIKNNYLQKLKKLNIEIHARSIFLQGLLLMDQESLDPFFDCLRPIFQKYLKYLQENNLSQLQAAINFITNLKEIDKIIIGICTCKQLKEIIDCIKNIASNNLNFEEFSYNDKKITNPSCWKLNLKNNK